METYITYFWDKLSIFLIYKNKRDFQIPFFAQYLAAEWLKGANGANILCAK
jgi:hypothetical protein